MMRKRNRGKENIQVGLEFMQQQTKQSPNLLKASIICFLSALFFVYEFFIQVSPGVMTQDLMRDLGVGAGGLGVLSAFYYYAYTPMQLPAGLLYDRFGPRVLLTCATCICALGALFFGLSHGIVGASAGRFLMGIGSAFAFTGTLLLVSRWFPSHYFAVLAGMLQMLSSVGALIGAEPLAHAVNIFGWRESILFIASIGFVIMFLIGLIVRDGPKSHYKHKKINKHNEWTRLKAVCTQPQSWALAIYAFCAWGPILVIAGLWGVPFLMTKYQIPNTQAAAAIAMIWWGVALGSPTIGWLSERIKKRKFPLVLCTTLGFISAILIIYTNFLPYWAIFPILVIFGFAAGSQTLTFAVVKDNNKPHSVGSAMGFNNMMVVAGGAILQPFVGFLLHAFWNGARGPNGVPIYTVTNYHWALLLVPICSFVGIIFSIFLIKETRCKSMY